MNPVQSFLRPLIAIPLSLLVLAGCTNRSGTAYIEVVNEQQAGGRAEPIMVDPRVEVFENEYRRSYLNEGSNIKQRIVIRGPIMIVPAPTTQPIPAR